MKRTTTILLLLISSLLYSQSNENNFIAQSYIEVTGVGEMEVIPNQIFLKIFINEKDIKTKSTIDELELSMINKLTEIGIDVEKDLIIVDLASNFKYYFIKENRIYVSKEFELMVLDAETVGKVIQELELLNISNISISRVDHSDIEKFKKEVKVQAIKAAKDKAEALVKEIDQTLGKAIIIKEIDNIQVINSLSGRVAGYELANIRIRENRVESEETLYKIEFEKIKLQYSILVRFEMK
jgi:uncharacterized protein